MIRGWIGLALLAGSWLFGLHYYRPASWIAWAVVVIVGAVLMTGLPLRLPTRRQSGLALALLLPAAWFMPWPYRAAPLVLLIGLAWQVVPVARRWSERLGGAAVCAGVVLLAQSLAMLAYAHQTARSHDLPWPLPRLLGAIAWLAGADVAVDGKALVMRSMREVHRLGATWDLLLDPTTFCFLAGGLALTGLMVWCGPVRTGWRSWLRLAGRLALIVAAWLPIRAGLLIGLFLHRVTRDDPVAPLTAMNQFLSPWTLLLMLAGPVLLAWRFVRKRPAPSPEVAESPLPEAAPVAQAWHYPAAMALVFAGLVVSTATLLWDPIGHRKDGRVMVLERHSTWEPTLRPYDTTWFGHDSSYSYAAIYQYCEQYYQMSRLLESDKIDDETLARCDVLVVKIPTAPFSPDEVDAIDRFVEQGGGLLFVGDHTNVFKSTSYLNQLVRPLGFVFRHDLLFSIGDPYDEYYRRELVPHPAVQHMPPMKFAVSCSIDPGTSCGRAAIQSTGLWNLMPEYNSENFHPHAEYRSEMRYGAFIQVWAARCGAGRAMAFTDSTLFSNFSVFEPGKAELMMGMLEWLNHRSLFDRNVLRVCLKVVLLLVGLAVLAMGLLLAWRWRLAWLVMLAAALLGWTAASASLVAFQAWAMPTPEIGQPMTRVVLDRTVSEVPLSHGGFIEPSGKGYALFEQWIPRLGYYTTRRSDREALSGSLLVVVCPTRSVSEEFREAVVDYVAKGGKLLVIDSADVENSTANSLLWPFGLASDHSRGLKGTLGLASGWPGIALEAVCGVQGGQPLLWVDKAPVAATVRYGEGHVMAIGFGSLFNDTSMGSNWMTEPDAAMLTRFDLLFSLVRAAETGQPMVEPAPRAEQPKEPKPAIPAKPPKKKRPGE